MTSVLLYSGGLDSYVTAHLMKPDVLLHVRVGSRYGPWETAHLARPAGCPPPVEVDLPLGLWERDDLIIPGRNAHLVLLAAHYGDTIMLAATAGDRVTDKDDMFAALMNGLLQHLYQPQWWLPAGRPVQLLLPVKNLSKRQLVARYLDAGGDPEKLATETFSCYEPDPGGTPCANCKPCARKWVALAANGIRPPFDAAGYVDDVYGEAIRAGLWDRGDSEAADVMDALAKAPA